MIMSIFLMVLTVYLLLRLKLFKNELNNMKKQLQQYNKRSTNKKLDLTLFNKNIEQLGIEINKLIDIHTQIYSQYKQIELNKKWEIESISHDLRTPLTSVLGYIQMAEDPDINKEERLELLHLTKKQGERLEILINDFFELSTIESVDYSLKLETINIKKVIQEVIISLHDRFKSKNIDPIIDLPQQELEIVADLSAVTRVLENILSNAVKYSEGNVNIYLKEENTNVIVTIENNTSNLTQESVNQIFNRFYMADRSRLGYGAGLGLSIAESFMEKMNGSIYAQLKNKKLSISCEWYK
ncbi:two-component sensor histidine kinase [Staphylococcus shinii]|uniref:histidine kinase n=2 Tax=Staphylococcus TaxID=1279 RepID=A0AAQ0LWU7_STAXY|nr:two-component sensor histidine kinase [Staphylococcus equorum]PTH95129.1 two-component sensor histidine kinase [Staphylococcus shinii]RIM90765.1 sensor histidine kinase [Staphylococcus xylosus]